MTESLDIQRSEEKQQEALEIRKLREEVAKLHGTQKLRKILDAPSPQALIQSMPPQELLYTFKDIGLADSAELVELATKEQLTYCLDLDCWEKDKFSVKKFEEWLQFLEANELNAAEKVLSALDPELLVFYYKKMFRIEHLEGDDAKAIREKEEEEETGDYIKTPDGFYVVHIPFDAEDHRSTIAHLSLNLFQQYGYEFTHRLFEAIRYSLPSDLEERAYQFHKGRMEDLGFIDYYEAIGIYQELPKHAKPFPPSFPVESSNLPIIAQPRPEGLFSKALQKIDDSRTQERIQFELMHLTNKVISADQIEIANPRAINKTIRFVQQIINIALELMAHNDADKAADLIAKYHIEWIFRNGFSLLAQLRRKAQKLAKNEGLTLISLPKLSLLGSPYLQLLNGLKQRKPKFYIGLEDITLDSYRPFRTLDDVKIAEEALDYIAFLPHFFFEYLPIERQAIRELATNIAFPHDIQEIEFFHIFLTALAHFYLYNTFEVYPLSPEEIQMFQNKIFIREGEPPYPIDPDFKERVLQALMKLPIQSPDETQFLQRFLNEMWHKLHEEAAYIQKDQKLDPRFINLFLVREDSLTA